MNHQYIWTVLTPLLVSLIVSVFAKEIRAVIGFAASSTARTVKGRLRLIAEDRLKLIMVLHGDAYKLLLWLCSVFRSPIWVSFVLGIAAIWLKLLWPTNPIWVFVAWSIPGPWIGTFLRVFEVVRYLSSYDESKVELAMMLGFSEEDARKIELKKG